MTADASTVDGPGEFPSTVWEDLHRAGDPSSPDFRDAFNSLAKTYWRPVHQFIRYVWKKPDEDAQDLTQEFFLAIFDPAFIAKSDPDRGSFRGFVITSLRNFLSNQERDRKRLKRGGGEIPLSLDFRGADRESAPVPIAAGETPEEYFDRAWARSVLDASLSELQKFFDAQGKPEAFRAFELFCLAEGKPPTYREIAEQLGVSEKQVDNFIYAARREFREIVTDTVRHSISDPTLLEEELRRLFG